MRACQWIILNGMRLFPGYSDVTAVVIFLSFSALPLRGSPTTKMCDPVRDMTKERVRSRSEESFALESVRKDVAAHPAEFITFETESSAMRFIVQHRPEAQAEAEPRVVARGIIGYWHGKTVIVLPSLSAVLR